VPTHTLAHRRRRGLPTRSKARKILRDKTVRGKSLTKPQKGFFGVIAGGGTPRRRRKRGAKA
jgi:hypothetical protein